jgi:diguanylate cyclase (GGDEF)-like protein/PAS domain S-box-containing protein/excisionase family DNA binding protein
MERGADPALGEAARALAEELSCGCVVMLFDRDSGEATVVAGHHHDRDHWALIGEHAGTRRRIADSQVLAGLRRGQTVALSPEAIDDRLVTGVPELSAVIQRIRLRALIGVPLRIGGETVGALLLTRQGDEEPFMPEDRERAEAAARRLAAHLDPDRFRIAFEHAPAGIALLELVPDEPRLVIREVNRAFCRITGRSREELIGADTRSLRDPGDVDALTAVDQTVRVFAAGLDRVSYERSIRRGDGADVWVHMDVAYVRHGPLAPALVLEVRELAARGAADAAERTEDAVFATDRDGVITGWNRGAERLFGLRASGALGVPLPAILPPEQREAMSRLLARVLEGEDIAGFESQVATAGAGRRDVALTLSPARDPAGAVTGLVGVAHDVTDRKRDEALRRAILDVALEGILTLDADGTITDANPAAERLFDRPAAELVGVAGSTLVAPADRDRYEALVRELADGRDAPVGHHVELRCRRSRGTTFPAELTLTRLPGTPVQLTAHVRDLGGRRRREREEELVAALTRRALERPDDASLLDDAAEAVAEVLGADAVEIHELGRDRTAVRGSSGTSEPGTRVLDVVPGEALDAAARAGRVVSAGGGDEPPLPAGWREAGVASAAIAPFRAGGVTGWLCALWRAHPRISTRDRAFLKTIAHLLATLTARRQADAELARRALHDGLTGLANRTLLLDRVEHALERARRTPASERPPTAIVAVGIDRFKDVNDILGHIAGDELLRAVAARLADHAGAGQTVARIGGDEFAILVEGREGERSPLALADAAVRRTGGRYTVGGRDVDITTSAGLVVAGPGAPESPTALLDDAVVAMYRAKEDGGGRFEVFGNPMRRRLLERAELQRGLRRAVADGALELHYQPIVSLGDGRIEAVEALVRWHAPGRGLLEPEDFVPIAEEDGTIVGIGRWALAEACRQLRRWDAADGPSVDRVSVNLAARQLADPGLADMVLETLRDAGVPPTRLTLEVTESVLLSDLQSASRTLGRLRDAGVSVLLDDFGTGWSSLGYLQQLPVDGVKIDRSFVAGLTARTSDRHIVAAIAGLAEAMELRIVAEGVESVAHATCLRSLGCRLGQGFAFGRPQPAAELGRLLRTGLARNGLSAAFGPIAGDDAPTAEEATMTLGDAQRVLGVSPSTVRRLTDAGRIRSIRTAGGHRRLVRSDVERVRRERSGDGAPVRVVPLPDRPLPAAADLLAGAGERIMALAARRVYEGEVEGWFASPAAVPHLAAWSAGLATACRTADWPAATEATTELVAQARHHGASLLEIQLLLEALAGVVGRVLAERGTGEAEVLGVRRLLVRLRNDTLAAAG